MVYRRRGGGPATLVCPGARNFCPRPCRAPPIYQFWSLPLCLWWGLLICCIWPVKPQSESFILLENLTQLKTILTRFFQAWKCLLFFILYFYFFFNYNSNQFAVINKYQVHMYNTYFTWSSCCHNLKWKSNAQKFSFWYEINGSRQNFGDENCILIVNEVL